MVHSWVVGAVLGFGGVLAAPSSPPLAQVTIGHDTYKYLGLVGKGEFPSDARDMFGDTMGGWGSAVEADLTQWKKNKDGSYTGILYGGPDRGWNTNGIVKMEFN